MSWALIEAGEPAMAAAGRELLGGDGTAAAFLASVRKDGGPRVHPVMPVIARGGLYVFVVNLSWKYHDLVRDGRYALHAALPPGGGRDFYVTGPAVEVVDSDVRVAVREACEQRLGGHEFEVLFELGVERALLTTWDAWGTANAWPRFEKWAATQA